MDKRIYIMERVELSCHCQPAEARRGNPEKL